MAESKFCFNYVAKSMQVPFQLAIIEVSYVIVSLCLCLQIQFDSLVLPLLRLGCFAKGVNCFPSIPTTPNGLTLNLSEPEFKTSQPPSEKIDEKSFVFAAAEILRFLRDMALDFSTAQSKSLLRVYQKDKVLSGSPPTMASALLHSTPSSHLVHPGAVLCMLDLLPGISFDSLQLPGDWEDEVGAKEVANGNSCNSPDSTEKACENVLKNCLTGEREVEKMSDGGMKLSPQPWDNEDLDDDNQDWALALEKSLEGKDTDHIIPELDSDDGAGGEAEEMGEGIDRSSREAVVDESESADGLTFSGLPDGDGDVSECVNCDGVEGCDKVVRMEEGGQNEEAMKWETDCCRMSADVAAKVCVLCYC